MNELSRSTNIFEYTNFRDFLKDVVASRKAASTTFSFRWFSKAAGFSSPNFLKLVIDGKRNLSDPSIEKFSKALKLNASEARFFRTLVRLNQAKTTAEKTLYAEELLKSRPYRALHPLQPAQFEYYSSWYLVAIRELIDTQGFSGDPEWIAAQLIPSISTAEIKRGLKILEDLGLIESTPLPTGGTTYKQKNAVLSTDDQVASTLLAGFHRQMIRLAEESIDRFAGDQREISAVTLSLSETGLRRAKEVIQKARKDLLEIAGQDRGQNTVFQLGMQLFPLTRSQSMDTKTTKAGEP